MTAFEWKTFFVWRVKYICVHVTQAQFLPTSSKHVSHDMHFLGLGIGSLSHQSCMSLHIGTNNIVGGSIIVTKFLFLIIVIIIFIIIIIFMMCRFNEYAGFTWSSCHAGVVRFLLDGCYGCWFVYVKQRTASRWPLRAGGTCTLLKTSFVDMNTYRHWVLIFISSASKTPARR